ncbi:MAG TPA: SUMF1/EgtB/PvdO family nonheme iron enzyme [Ktedonobacterales bacterium]
MSGPTPSDTPRVFVSHSHEDDQYCHDFVAELRALLGSDDAVWYDEHNLGSGELLTEIQRQLHARPIFVVVLSPAALHRSTWVSDECRWAFQLRQREPARVILPVTGMPIETADFYPDWMYLEGYKRIEAPGMRPFPPQEAARRAHHAIASAQTPAQVVLPGKPEPAPAPKPARPILPRERFPERLERLGFEAHTAKDPTTGKEVTYLSPPLCPVPAGPFLMGSDPRQDSQAHDDEQPEITVELPSYLIAKFPVTVAEYACFVAAGHAAPTKGTLGMDWQAQLARLDHPVTCVTWFDARDYAAWVARLTGQPIGLPSEAEWEKAARWDVHGNSGRGYARIYPWGDHFDSARCNTSESGIKTTTAVGTYGAENPARDGSSACGAQDMAGNVWEWTRTIYEAQSYRNGTSREDDKSPQKRVIRGGSWKYDSDDARTAYRNYDRPGDVDDDTGFRVVLLSAAM